MCNSGLGGKKFHIEILGFTFSRGFFPLGCSVLKTRLMKNQSSTECPSSLKSFRITTQLRSAAGSLTHINKFSILVSFKPFQPGNGGKIGIFFNCFD